MSATNAPTAAARLLAPSAVAFSAAELTAAVARVREPVHVVQHASGAPGLAFGGSLGTGSAGYAWLATLPPLYPEWLGDRAFLEVHRVRFPYATGSMANGIATSALVIAMAKAQMLGFFGAAGLSPDRVDQALAEIAGAVGPNAAWGSNLIHSPNEPELEDAIVDLYLRRGVVRVDASAYMNLTPAVVRYACAGLFRDPQGAVRRTRRILAKISRPEVARRFLAPAPGEILDALVSRGQLSAEQADLARRVPLAEDITVESDSGGHTDNRPLAALFPTIATLRDAMARQHGYVQPIRLGAAGGLGTPGAVAAAFALGAAYVMTGSVNQAAVESGLSSEGRRMLADADVADVTMAPAADMFELGVKLQVLRRGTLFATRATRLYEAYVAYDSLESLPRETRERLESEVFRAPLATIWDEARRFWEARDPREAQRAERDGKHRMALVFRWYLGKSSRWAIAGDTNRRMDYQIWCGPAMGAFNAWAAGSFLDDPEARGVVQIARNLLEGAAVVTRAQQLRTAGVPVPATAFDYRPRPLS
jgi:trans-AT polyketide synthase, acyltransferase and oxidoreductase domains